MIVIIRVKRPDLKLRMAAVEKHIRAGAHLLSVSLLRTIGVAAAGWALCSPISGDYVNLIPADRAVHPDPRAAKLEAFFHYYHCPEPHHVFEYLRVTETYGLDYRLLPAISVRETQCGVVVQDLNNWWGYHPGRQTFPSIEKGIDYVARQLAENPLYRDKSLHDKLFTYNPLPAYPDEVRRIMRQIE